MSYNKSREAEAWALLRKCQAERELDRRHYETELNKALQRKQRGDQLTVGELRDWLAEHQRDHRVVIDVPAAEVTIVVGHTNRESICVGMPIELVEIA